MANYSKKSKDKMLDIFETVLDRAIHLVRTQSYVFICNELEYLLGDDNITIKDYEMALKWFQSQRPTERLHKEFFKHKTYRGYKTINVTSAWWDASTKGDKQRVKFLKVLITKLQK